MRNQLEQHTLKLLQRMIQVFFFFFLLLFFFFIFLFYFILFFIFYFIFIFVLFLLINILHFILIFMFCFLLFFSFYFSSFPFFFFFFFFCFLLFSSQMGNNHYQIPGLEDVFLDISKKLIAKNISRQTPEASVVLDPSLQKPSEGGCC